MRFDYIVTNQNIHFLCGGGGGAGAGVFFLQREGPTKDRIICFCQKIALKTQLVQNKACRRTE